MTKRFSILFCFVLFCSFCFCKEERLLAPAPPPLQSYNINPDTVTVSGISSGGFMSAQLFVIYSSLFQGLGIVAGGPYHCARGKLTTALNDCMDSSNEPPTDKFIQEADERSGTLIDVTSNMTKKNAFILSGALDTVVSTPVVKSGIDFFTNYGVNITFVQLAGAEHCQPTDDPANTNPCDLLESPYISDCNYDAAGVTLQTIYSGTLNDRNNGPLNGDIITFNQEEFGSHSDSFGSTGYLYVPDNCSNGEKCTLHVALHGCLQNVDIIGTDYIAHGGYNKWADTNSMIILYPQTSRHFPNNDDACWDWWGYTSSSKYDTNEGTQPKAILAMINQIMGNS